MAHQWGEKIVSSGRLRWCPGSFPNCGWERDELWGLASRTLARSTLGPPGRNPKAGPQSCSYRTVRTNFFPISCSVLTISFVLLVLLIILQRRLVANGRRSVEGQSLIIPRSLFMRASTRLRVMLLPCYHADVVCIHGRAQACRLGCLLESIGNPEAYNFYTAARPLGGKIRSTNIKRGQLFFACPCMRAGKKYLLFAYLCWLL
jgi:hypothetical protein